MKNNKFVKEYTKGVIGASVGANFLERIGGNIANSGAQGLNEISNVYPTISLLGSGQQTINLLKNLSKGQKKKGLQF